VCLKFEVYLYVYHFCVFEIEGLYVFLFFLSLCLNVYLFEGLFLFLCLSVYMFEDLFLSI